jgi:beta-glucuronidase
MDVKPRGSELIEYDYDHARSLQVPGDWNTQAQDLFYYEGTVWYRKKFSPPALNPGERAYLYFGAANYRADVYLNGRKLGMHVGGFTPFCYEVTGQLRPGDNSLVVRVDNKRYKDAVPTLNTDWWNYGGLTREVKFVTVPSAFIAAHRLHLESVDSGVIAGEVDLVGTGEGQRVTLSIPELQVEATAETDAKGRAHFHLATTGLTLWTPEQPKLYDVRFAHGRDVVTDQIGFRTIATAGRQLRLNGKPVFLRGICIHDEYPLQGGGRVVTPEQSEQLLRWAKELGCNFVRLAHYPHTEATLRLADRLGLLVWSEIPVYWTISWNNPDTYRNAEAQLSDMITRDYERAAIVIWSLANETPVNAERTKFLTALANRARTLDATRLLSAAMEKHPSPTDPNTSIVRDPLADVVDLVSFNQYIGWYDGTPEKCDRVKWQIDYNKPIFISEFGGDAKQGLHGDKTQRWTEEYQANLYVQTLKMLDRIDGLVGFSPWILVDFRSPRRPLPGIQDGFNRKGLVSSDGIKKQAFTVLQEYYAAKAAASR